MVSDFADQGDSVVVTIIDGRTLSGAALVAAGTKQNLIIIAESF
jgi:hypothetical protein